jgi:hypothetical protein
VVRASVSLGRIPVTWHEDLGAQLLGPCDGGVNVIYLEPQEQAVPRRQVVRIADASVVMLLLPPVQLQHELA